MGVLYEFLMSYSRLDKMVERREFLHSTPQMQRWQTSCLMTAASIVQDKSDLDKKPCSVMGAKDGNTEHVGQVLK